MGSVILHSTRNDMSDQNSSWVDKTEAVRVRFDQAWRQMTARLELLELEEHRKRLDLALRFQQEQARCYDEEDYEAALEVACAEHYKELLAINSNRACEAKQARAREIIREFEKQIKAILNSLEEGSVHPGLLEQARYALWSVSGHLAGPEGQGG